MGLLRPASPIQHETDVVHLQRDTIEDAIE